MNLIKSRMTTIGVAAAVLALVAVQALAFSQATQPKDPLQPTAPASDLPVQKSVNPTPASEPGSDTTMPKPAITGVSVDDDDSEAENEIEDDD